MGGETQQEVFLALLSTLPEAEHSGWVLRWELAKQRARAQRDHDEAWTRASGREDQ